MVRSPRWIRGFSEETVRFLAGIRDHNWKEWFDSHRDDYQEMFLAPAQSFAEALAPRLRKSARLRGEKSPAPGRRIVASCSFEGNDRNYRTAAAARAVSSDPNDAGAILLRSELGEMIRIGTTFELTYSVSLVPGAYDVYYESDGGGVVAPGNGNAKLRCFDVIR